MAPLILGVDIAKKFFDVHFLDHHSPKSSHTLSNDTQGFEALARLLLELPEVEEVVVGIEPTSIYHLELADWAHQMGWQVHMLNPAWGAAFRRSSGPGHKTDALDAWSLAEMVRQRRHLLSPWQPEAPIWATMRRLQRRRQQLVKQHTAESNRLESTLKQEHELRASLERSLAFLKKEINLVEKQVDELLAQCESACHQIKRLQQIPGIGPVSARTLTLELGDLGQYTHAKELTAKVGLVPYQNSSGGIHKRPRLGRAGNPAVKRVLYMAASSALRANAWKEWLQPQRERKEGKKLIVAVMDKLLRLSYGVIKNDQDFDKNLAFGS